MINNMMPLAKIGSVQELPHLAQETPIPQPTTSFREILGSQMQPPIHLSKHAALRLEDRNISLTGEQIDRVADGIGKANEKGIRDSLVLVDDLALIVNIQSRTVITAISQMQENIFSNIDGAVIV